MECFLQEIIRWRKVHQKEAGFLKKDLHEKEIFMALCRIFGEVPVEFRSCNTYAGTSCMITINGKQILLYDVYLTETFNGMNLMYLKGSGQQSMEKYCCRLVADQLFSMGRYDGSLYMIQEYAFTIYYFGIWKFFIQRWESHPMDDRLIVLSCIYLCFAINLWELLSDLTGKYRYDAAVAHLRESYRGKGGTKTGAGYGGVFAGTYPERLTVFKSAVRLACYPPASEVQ